MLEHISDRMEELKFCDQSVLAKSHKFVILNY